MKRKQIKRPHGIDFGGIYDPSENRDYYDKENTKKLLLPLQVRK